MGYRYFTWQEVKGFGDPGWKKHQNDNVKIYKSYLCRSKSGLKYDTSWDWLMPVVEKISNNHIPDRLKLLKLTIFEPIAGVYPAVIEAIHWLNLFNPKPIDHDRSKE